MAFRDLMCCGLFSTKVNYNKLTKCIVCDWLRLILLGIEVSVMLGAAKIQYFVNLTSIKSMR